MTEKKCIFNTILTNMKESIKKEKREPKKGIIHTVFLILLI